MAHVAWPHLTSCSADIRRWQDDHEHVPYDPEMAYDEELANRIRWLIGADPELTERKMFGGLAFLIRGHMAITASREGGVLLHVDPARAVELVATTGAAVRGEIQATLRKNNPSSAMAK